MPSITLTGSKTVTETPTGTVTVTPSFSASHTPNATLTAVALSFSPTPEFMASGTNETIFVPCPVKQGNMVTIYFRKPPSQSIWKIYSVAGELVYVGSVEGRGRAQWNTAHSASGVYLAWVQVTYGDGSKDTFSQKLAVLP
jgi:hypothetical protein